MARPSRYRKEYAELAYKLCLLGATDAEMADILGVKEQTLNNWKKAHPEFFESLKTGKAIADAKVAHSLFQRANGYSHPDTDIRVIDGKIVQTEITKHYPPDTVAGIFWLKNRRKKDFRDKIDHEVTGEDGGPVQHNMTVTFVDGPGE